MQCNCNENKHNFVRRSLKHVLLVSKTTTVDSHLGHKIHLLKQAKDSGDKINKFIMSQNMNKF